MNTLTSSKLFFQRAATHLYDRLGPSLPLPEIRKELAQEADQIRKLGKPTLEQLKTRAVIHKLFGREVSYEEEKLIEQASPNPWEEAKQQAWANYSIHKYPTKAFLKKALQLAENEHTEKKTIDLGSGNSPWTLELLERDWEVVAVDISVVALSNLEKSVLKQFYNKENLSFKPILGSIENTILPENRSLITASSSLPYCNPEKIPDIFKKVQIALKPNGYFAGNFFVKPLDIQKEELQRDKSKIIGGMFFSTQQLVRGLAEEFDFKIVYLNQPWLKKYQEIEFILQKK